MNSEETTLIKESTSTLCFILFFSDNAVGVTEMGLGEQKTHAVFTTSMDVTIVDELSFLFCKSFLFFKVTTY